MDNKGEIVIYKAHNGNLVLDVKFKSDTVWLTQKQMSILFKKDVKTINRHIVNVFKEGELLRKSVISKNEITASDGKKYNTAFYNLDVIISVGYRVHSKEGALFRIWATKILKEYILKGHAINEQGIRGISDYRLKNVKEGAYANFKTLQVVSNNVAKLFIEASRITEMMYLFNNDVEKLKPGIREIDVLQRKVNDIQDELEGLKTQLKDQHKKEKL